MKTIITAILIALVLTGCSSNSLSFTADDSLGFTDEFIYEVYDSEIIDNTIELYVKVNKDYVDFAVADITSNSSSECWYDLTDYDKDITYITIACEGDLYEESILQVKEER
jgi:uncharacterized protein YcfL